MKLPNAENAVMARDKLCEYLLSPDHVRGASKANLLLLLGYGGADWHRLEMDIRRDHVPVDVNVSREHHSRLRRADPSFFEASGRLILEPTTRD